MKILILTIGSRGDVQPYVALGQGLRQAGHAVTLCTGELFKEMVTTHGLVFAPMDDEMIRLADSPDARQMIEGGGNPLKAINLVKPMIRRITLALAVWPGRSRNDWPPSRSARYKRQASAVSWPPVGAA